MGLFDFLVTSKEKSSSSFGFAPRSPEENASYNQFADFTGKLVKEAPDFSSVFKSTTDFASKLTEQAGTFTSGAFLDPSDPTNKSFIEATNRPMQQQFKEQTIPGLEGYLAKSGGTGGSRGTELIRQAYRDFETVLGDNSSKALANIGGVRAAGFQAGAGGVAQANQSVLDILTSIQNAQKTQFAMAPHSIQTGASGQRIGSTLDALTGLADLATTAFVGYKIAGMK